MPDASCAPLILNPRQLMKSPAIMRATLLPIVQIPFKSFHHMKQLRESSRCCGIQGQCRTFATSAQQERQRIFSTMARQFGFQFPNKSRIARQRGPRRPRYMRTPWNVAHERSFFSTSYIDQYSLVRLNEMPCEMGRHFPLFIEWNQFGNRRCKRHR